MTRSDLVEQALSHVHRETEVGWPCVAGKDASHFCSTLNFNDWMGALVDERRCPTCQALWYSGRFERGLP